MTLSDLRCQCGATEIVLIDPGAAPVTAPGGILIQRGREPGGTCLACWPMLRGFQQELGV